MLKLKFMKKRRALDVEKESLDFFKKILGNISLGGLFVGVDRTVKLYNQKAEKIFGYPTEDVIGKQTDRLYGDRRSDPSNKNEIYKELEKKGFHIGYARGLTKDNREIKLMLSTFVVKPNNGAIIFAEKAEGAPEFDIDKERLLQHLLDSMPDMIYFKDIDNRFLLVNKAHADALNVIPEEVIGKSDLDLFPKELAEKYDADDKEILRTGKPIIGKIESAKRTDGGMTYVSTTKVPHYDEDGRIIGTIGITRNITEQMIAEGELRVYKDYLEELVKKRTRELEETNERLLRMYNIKSDFTSMVSHELRTPLTGIKEGVSVIADGTLGAINDMQKRSLKLASENIDRLTRLINDILDLAKLENMKMEFRTVETNINEIIAQVIESYRASVNKKGLKLNLNLEPSLPLVKLDPDRISQVLHNLVNNAIKFTDEGSITVKSGFDGDNINVSISDTGCGMKDKDLPRIFEKFQQIPVSDNGVKRSGTGLGLAICKQIVEQLGGRIFVESEYARGSKFYFTLPAN